MIPTIYLGGPIAGCNDEEIHGWRDYVKSKSETFRSAERGNFEANTAPVGVIAYRDIHFYVLDPTVRDYRGQHITTDVMLRLVEWDLIDIRAKADAILVNYLPSKACVGSIMECKDAWEFGKVVVVNVPTDYRVSPWFKYHSHQITTSLDDAIEFILQRFK